MENQAEDNFNPPTCGGQPKPEPKIGELGEWRCEGNPEQWIWFPAV